MPMMTRDQRAPVLDIEIDVRERDRVGTKSRFPYVNDLIAAATVGFQESGMYQTHSLATNVQRHVLHPPD